MTLDKVCEVVIVKGFIATSELRELGVTRSMIDKYLMSKDLIRMKIGQYIVNHQLLVNYVDRKNKELENANIVPLSEGEIKLTTVYSSLVNGQIERAKKELKIYLENIGKSEYLNLGHILIDYDWLVGDPAFYTFIITFAKIDVNEYVFDKQEYENARDEAISRNEKQKVWLYEAILADAENRENIKKLSLQ